MVLNTHVQHCVDRSVLAELDHIMAKRKRDDDDDDVRMRIVLLKK